MIRLIRPSTEDVAQFLAGLRTCPLTYGEVGCTGGEPPPGYLVDRNRVRLGSGIKTFERACHALRTWRMLRLGWVDAVSPDAPISVGTVVAITTRVLGLHGVFACRIVAVEDDPNGGSDAFGFTYGTLPGHLEPGQE